MTEMAMGGAYFSPPLGRYRLLQKRLSFLSLSVGKPLKFVTQGQCDARPTVTFPAANVTTH